ncbi:MULTISPECIES: substrate-binding domain-containing protein [unclassified Salinibacterium]|uniref:substrate-binding domain-containing protein n=1 Tax=unclassified Salinibacterium TaxID=2632331 RepID=UPI00142087B3|nr:MULTISPECIES: substrate-binding domain-containing protein [unclassified Salinibacterium]
MRATKKYLIPALIASVGLALAGCAPTATTNEPAAEGEELAPVAVSLITSQTGPLATYGEAYIAGFEAGIDYATDGTKEAGGRAIDITISDDAGDADTAVNLARDAIGQGTKILAGTASSGIALALAEQAEQNKVLYISGPAAADGITGVNGYTFRSGRQTYQDVATAGTFIGDPAGKSVLVLAQNNAFGNGNFTGVQAVLGGKGAEVTSVLVPEDATEFTPFAQQIVQAAPDLVFVAWAGATSGAMWQSLDQQGVFDATTVVTGLGDVATYGAYAAAGEKISFLNHYHGGAADNEVEAAMIKHLEANGHKADLFSPDGFNAALMIVQAIEEGGGDDVDAMIDSLEGWEFEGPKGTVTIRAEDHAMLQNMYQAKLTKDGETWVPELIDTIDADTVTPPLAK